MSIYQNIKVTHIKKKKKKDVETSHCPDLVKSEGEFYTTNVRHALGLKAVAHRRQQKYRIYQNPLTTT